MKSSKKNETETTELLSSKVSVDGKDGQIDKKVNQKKKYATCFSIGCGIPLMLTIAFFVWIFASPSEPNSSKKDTASEPIHTQSATEKKQSTAQPSAKTKQPTVKSPPRVTTNCDGNFVPPKSVALKINTDKPGLKKDINTHYYKIYGNTKSDIIAGIQKCGPGENGNTYAAFTRYQINFAYETSPTKSGCSVENATVGVQIDLYYPKWESTKDAEAGLDDRWKAYYKLVEKHENVHVEYVLDTAKDILKYLNSLSDVPYYSIDRGIQPYYDRLDAKHEKFDAKEYPAARNWFK
ncbi:MAG TPA: DUF922 domain-containing protein [Candidatus Moranbacteria bacterium]|nr:DUF922 domain-containing protein [Candidatus Moranbacteria bacterium]HRY27968.1 DUF922 domain-containing protein [Candidatus Moranbacteria bacterium]HSA08216.1 DUF922 domain-containing protein [Candidatus Moranbacteria bacterium]